MGLAGTAFVRVDADMAPFARQTAAGVSAFERRFEGSWANVGQRLARTGSNMSRLGQQMNRTVTLPLLALGAASVKAASDFEGAMTQVRTQAGASRGEIERMRGAILKLGPTVGKTPVELANALFHIESAGIRGTAALNDLTAAAKLSQIGHADLETTVNAVVAVMRTAPKDVKSASDAIGLLNATVGQGNMRMTDLTAAMSSGVLPAAKSVGLGLRDVGSALDVMTIRGVPAQDAATRLRMTFSLLAAPTKQASKELAGIGIGQSTLAKDMRKPDGLVVALSDLKAHMEHAGLSAIQQNQLIARAFGGGRSSSAIITLIQNVDELKKHFDGIGKQATPQNVNEAWQTTTHDLGFRFDQLKSDAISAAAKIGQAIGPSLISFAKDIVHDASSIANAFSKLPKGAQDTILRGGLILAGIGPALRLVGVFTTGIGRLYDAALVIRGIMAGGGVIGKLRGTSGAAAANTAGKVTATVGTMEVGTLIARAVVGGAVGGIPIGGPVAAGERSAGGVIIPAGVRSLPGTAPAPVAAPPSLLSRLGGRLMGAAPVAAPIILIAAGTAVGGKGGKTLQLGGLGALGAGMVAGAPAALSVAAATAIAAPIIATAPKMTTAKDVVASYNKEVTKLISHGNVQGLAAFAAQLQKIGAKPEVVRQLQSLSGALGGVKQDIFDLTHGAIVNFNQLEGKLSTTFGHIKTIMAVDPQEGATLMDRAFSGALSSVESFSSKSGHLTTQGMRQMETVFAQFAAGGPKPAERALGVFVQNVQGAMRAGVIATRQGMSLIANAFEQEAKAFGLPSSEAKKVGRAAAVNVRVTGFAPSSDPTARPQTSGTRARGGLTQFGQPGDVGFDTIATTIGGQGVAVAPGEVAAVFNRHQLPIVNARLADFGGLPGFFDQVNRPHYAAKGGLIPKFASGGVLSNAAIDALRRRAGLPPIFDWIAQAESGGNPSVINSIGATGLWQIYNHPDLVRRFGPMTDPWHNAEAAKVLFSQSGLAPWAASRSVWGKHLGAGALTTGGGSGVIGAIFKALSTPRVDGPASALKSIVQGALTRATAGANRQLRSLAASSGGGGGGGAGTVGPAGGPSGTSIFQGIPVANWIIPELRYAQAHGWHGHITSGFRGGFDPHAPSGSEHALTRYPGGAVDFGGMVDPAGLANKFAFMRATAGYGGRRLLPAQGFRDDGHMSGTGHARGGIVGNLLRAATGALIHGRGPGAFHGHPLKTPIRKRLTAPFKVKGLADFDPLKLTAAVDKELERLTNQETLLDRLGGITLPDGTTKSVLDSSDIGLLAATFPPKFAAGTKITDAELKNRNWALQDMVGKVGTLKAALFTISTATAERERRKALVQAFLKQQFGRYQRLTTDLADLKSSNLHRRLAAAADQSRRGARINDAKGTIAHYQTLIADEQAKGKHADHHQIDQWRGKIRQEDAFIRAEHQGATGKLTSAKVAVLRDNIGRELKPVKADLTQFGGAATHIGKGGVLGTLTSDLTTLADDKGTLSDSIASLLQSDIPGLKLDIRALGATPPATDTATATTAQADALRTLLDQAHLALSVSQAQYKVLSDFPPFGGSFAEGGVVPGPVGSPRMILAHGGEVVHTVGDDGGSIGDVHVHLSGGLEQLERFVDVRVERSGRRTSRHAGYALPGRGGGLSR